MTSFSVNCPGKVLLFGEYSCLVDGPAVLKVMNLNFSLRSTQIEETGYYKPEKIFHPESPAGRLLKKYFSELGEMFFMWGDPFLEIYNTPIGVGSSTAQFLLLSRILKIKNIQKRTPEELISEYWEFTTNQNGIRPSGVDLLAQELGYDVIVQTNSKLEFRPIQFSKLYENYGLGIVYYGSKIMTHEHLVRLKRSGFPTHFEKDLSLLKQYTMNAIDQIEKGNGLELKKTMIETQILIESMIPSSQGYRDLIKIVSKTDGICAAKGSGSQGGDCILVLYEKSKLEFISDSIKAIDHTFITI